MRVLLINKLYDPWIGGVETVVKQIAEGIADAGDDVTVLVGNELTGSDEQVYTNNGVKIFKVKSFAFRFSTPISFFYLSRFRELSKNADVIHFHTPNPLGELAANFTKIGKKTKVLVTVHADALQTRWKILAPIYNLFLQRLLKRADTITVTGKSNANSFECLRKHQHKVVVVPLAYNFSNDLSVETIDPEPFLSRFKIKRDQKTLLFVGRLSYYKGIDYLLDAVKLVPDVQLIIVGDGEMKEHVVNRIQSEDLNRVIMTGPLDDASLLQAYKASSIFVLPSTTTSEAFGIVQAEAMKFGLPVINTDLPTAVPSVSLNGETGITVKPADVQELKEAIEKICNNSDLYNLYSANAEKRAKLFSPKAMVNSFHSLYTTDK